MKKIIILSIGISSLLFTSCRENDDILSSEDVTTLKIIQSKRNIRESKTIETNELNTLLQTTESDNLNLNRDAGTLEAIKPPKL